ncbi:hypothetical protein GKZ28_05205 [Clostridium chromiireducens]|uniref:Uncharacterized protein n=1 Tax=Clostridium chromiireducens TaxID=225345 RepID=A0A964RK61_9CLOT|nr:hypothetical protein [Clostridium chromiireducens]MVX63095.1 hypothetical protein [Clostridium chromiireducens]
MECKTERMFGNEGDLERNVTFEQIEVSNNIMLNNQNELCDKENLNTSSEIANKICKDLNKAQENFIAPVDEEFLADDTLDKTIWEDINKAKESGAFIPTKYLTLIHGSETTTKIFAKLVVRNGNRGEPVIVLAYTDGGVSPELEISKAELMRISFGNYGVKENGFDKKDVAYASTLIKKIGDRILPYWEFDIGMTLMELLKLLSGKLSVLKIDRGEELDVKMVYSFIYKYVQRVKSHPAKCYIIRRGFYALISEDILEVASNMNSKVPTIIKMLKQNNLLHLQDSSVGNQCEVKGVGSCYCIKMLAKYQENEVQDFSGNAFDQL